MRALAVASPKRTGPLPDLPTISEAGYPDHEVKAGRAWSRR